MKKEAINLCIAHVITFLFSILIVILFTLGTQFWIQALGFSGSLFGLAIVRKKEPFTFQNLFGKGSTPEFFPFDEDMLSLRAIIAKYKKNKITKVSMYILSVILLYVFFSQVFIHEPLLKKTMSSIVYHFIHIIVIFIFTAMATVSFCNSWFIIGVLRNSRSGM